MSPLPRDPWGCPGSPGCPNDYEILTKMKEGVMAMGVMAAANAFQPNGTTESIVEALDRLAAVRTNATTTWRDLVAMWQELGASTRGLEASTRELDASTRLRIRYAYWTCFGSLLTAFLILSQLWMTIQRC